MKKRIIACLLLCVMVAQLLACGAQEEPPKLTQNIAPVAIQATNLMEDIAPNSVNTLPDLGEDSAAVTDFAVRLFRAGKEDGKNVLISPLSVMYALAMTANGADGETLVQMETVLGMSTQELNAWLYSYWKSLPQGEKYKLKLANSIWFTDHERFTVNRDFLQTNADYYGADIYRAPMNGETCRDMNNWVKEHTDGMIPQILDKIPGDAIMYLINALVFDAQWSEIYAEPQIREGEFTAEDGTKRTVDFMHSTESLYLEDGLATGFVKYYKGGKYAFVAMLPKEGVTVSQYVDSLDGAALQAMLEDPRYYDVRAAIPRFESEYSTEMSALLSRMGMPAAFDLYNANFSKMGTSTDGNIHITRVVHKTFISVDANGTKAGAATLIEAGDGCAMEPQEIKEVRLDRPFVYMLIDCENNIPFFLGTMLDTGA